MATLTNPKTFKGILQVKSLPTNPEKGYIYLVGDGSQGGNGTGIYFGSRYYGKTENSAEIIALKNDITANTKSISDIEAVLGEWQASLGTVATAVVAVSGATETNATNISNLSTTVANNLTATTEAINDAKNEAINTATGYTNTQINEVKGLINGIDVSAEGDSTYITATASDKKVTVAATKKTIDAIALAETALQASDIAVGDTNGTIKVGDTDVAVKGLGSAAYTESSAYDASGAADNAFKNATGYTDSAITTVNNTFNAYTGATDTVLSGLRSDIDTNTNKLKAILEESGVTDAIDSFVELQGWIEEHGNEVCGITSSITENKNAISAANNTFNAYTGATDTVLSGLRSDIDNISSTSVNNSSAITNLTNNKLDATVYTAYTASTRQTLDNIESSLTAITNNAVTSVASSGKTITTSNTKGAVNVDVNTLSVADAQSNGYIALEKGSDGALYGVMYYGGDDAE